MELSRSEINIIKESLQYTIKAVSEYDGYDPDPIKAYEFKRKRLDEIMGVLAKVRAGEADAE